MFLIYSKRNNEKWRLRGTANTDYGATVLNNMKAEQDREEFHKSRRFYPEPVQDSYQVRKI